MCEEASSIQVTGVNPQKRVTKSQTAIITSNWNIAKYSDKWFQDETSAQSPEPTSNQCYVENGVCILGMACYISSVGSNFEMDTI